LRRLVRLFRLGRMVACFALDLSRLGVKFVLKFHGAQRCAFQVLMVFSIIYGFPFLHPDHQRLYCQPPPLARMPSSSSLSIGSSGRGARDVPAHLVSVPPCQGDCERLELCGLVWSGQAVFLRALSRSASL
jgi:hypothetical protein